MFKQEEYSRGEALLDFSGDAIPKRQSFFRRSHAIYAVLFVIGNGGVLYSFSELFFWGFWRPLADDFGGTLWGLLFYSLIAYVLLFVVRLYQVRTLPQFFALSVLYGVLVEVVIAWALYSSGVLIVAFVSFPWHSIVSVLFGWNLLPRFLSSPSRMRRGMGVTLFALLFVLWAIGWRALPDGDVLTLSNFILHTIVTTLFLATSFFLVEFSRKRMQLSFSRAMIAGVLVALFVLHVLTHSAFLLFSIPLSIIVPGFLIFLLRYLRKKQGQSMQQGETVFPAPMRMRGIFFLLIIPMVAVPFATFFFQNVPPFETNYLFAIPLFCIFVFLIGRSTRRIFWKPDEGKDGVVHTER